MGAGIGRSASGFGRARARGRVGAVAASGEARRPYVRVFNSKIAFREISVE